MDFYALSPPNSATLSDNVIGSVAQCTWAVRSRKEHVGEMPLYKQQAQRHTYRQAPYMRSKARLPTTAPGKCSNASDNVTPSHPALTSVMNSMEQTSSPTGRTRESVRRSDLKAAKRIISSIQTSKYPISVELQAAIVTEALKKRIRHRERCRVNQASYRQRQLKTENDIQDEIVTLHAEIKELELRGQDPFHLPTTPTSWVLAAEYFRHLRHFLSTPASLQTTTTDFLRGMLAPDVVGASSFGVAAQIENWKLFALYFADADLELKGMSSPTPDTLVASTSTTVTITSNTLRYAFPHLNSDGNGGAQGGVWSPLAARMLEQKLLVRGWFTFGWDDSSDRVVRLQTRADVLSPMLKLLGSLEDVSCAFENAMITPECQFVRRE